MSATKDLTTGNVTKQLLGFAAPVLLGQLLQQLYNIVDTAIVGKALGVEPLAAVGATGSIMFMIIGMCNGMCSGCAIPVAQRFGAKDEAGVRKSVAGCLWVGIIMAIILTSLTSILCRNILVWMDTPENIIDYAYSYLIVILLGIPATILYNMLAGIMRALGDSKTPLNMLMLSTGLNLLLDLLFILVLGLGISGASLATVISQLISGLLCLRVVKKKYEILHMTREEMKYDGEEVKRLVGVGFPMGLQFSVTAIGSILLQTSVNGLGSDCVASMVSGGKLNMFFMAPFDALGAALATFTGQNLGAGKLDRIKESVKKSMAIGMVYAVLIFTISFFFSGKLALVFVDASETAIIHNIRYVMLINQSFYWFLLAVDVYRFVIQGLGYSNLAIISGFLEMVARAFMGVFIVPKLGFVFACMASPLAWVMAVSFLIPTYYKLMKKVAADLNRADTSVA